MTRDLSTPPVILPGSLAGSPQPVLPAAQGLLLRPWEPADAAAFLFAYQDEDIRRWHTRRPWSETRVREWFDRYRQDWEQEKGGHWAVTRDGGEVLGRIKLGNVNFDEGIADIGYWVLPAARGAGVAPRALSALSVWAMNEIGFPRLCLDHSTRNHASCRVATKSGYVLEGTKRSAGVHDDGRHDMHLHARVRDV
ncbi:GNAT family N-acetyltransferase [Kitasatospora sp. NBC_00240]|uniref:GNAT family N-acetyltransferase n=1 Tax=Kitasatospora sp. NBC_00240 TaxID=2903567 RepID=UPI0022509F39|nr:GNAT family N-acetyltransferase [Kitasatospora sp. NBC_00240]MCX5208424.1 GNAT family N-acetyltransferase [Kitasatospora sp. NBC_00240]